MAETLYRPIRNGEMITSAALDGSLCATEPADRPEQPQMPTAQFYCNGDGCPVRVVTVQMKLYGEPPPKSYTCPVCGGPLQRQGYRREFLLVPAAPVMQTDANDGRLHDSGM